MKITIAISMVIFILIVANIIFIGIFQEKMAVPVDTNTSKGIKTVGPSRTVTTSQSSSTPSTQIPQSSQTSQTQTSQTTAPSSTVTHITRTRAS